MVQSPFRLYNQVGLCVRQMLQYMVQVVEHGPGDEPPLNNHVDRLKPKRMQLEAIGCWCRQALKVGPKQHLLLWGKNDL